MDGKPLEGKFYCCLAYIFNVTRYANPLPPPPPPPYRTLHYIPFVLLLENCIIFLLANQNDEFFRVCFQCKSLGSRLSTF